MTKTRTTTNRIASRGIGVVTVLACLSSPLGSLRAADLIVELTNSARVSFVGAVDRWDADGNPRRPVNPKAKIQLPDVDAIAMQSRPNTWKFADLPAGRYDLVILVGERIRIEGFGFPPVREFDPFLTHKDKTPDAVRDWISADIAKSTRYENKVSPLYFAGKDKQVRLLVQLLRDKPTSFDREFGEPAATLRHELWQYDHRYGAWSKEKHTRVFDRILMAKRELRQWTWVWEPRLGDVRVSEQPTTVRYTLPKSYTPTKHVGLLPY